VRVAVPLRPLHFLSAGWLLACWQNCDSACPEPLAVSQWLRCSCMRTPSCMCNNNNSINSINTISTLQFVVFSHHPSASAAAAGCAAARVCTVGRQRCASHGRGLAATRGTAHCRARARSARRLRDGNSWVGWRVAAGSRRDAGLCVCVSPGVAWR
jgi:hypothetical protein